MPTTSININEWHLPKELHYADPEFYVSNPIDILIGAELFFTLLLPGRLSPGTNLPRLQHTLLGWIAAGTIPADLTQPAQSSQSKMKRTHCAIVEPPITNAQLDSQLKKFWEIEDIPNAVNPSFINPCEQHFKSTTIREQTGRYVVSLPRRPNAPPLGNSKALALKRFYSLEKRLAKDSSLHSEYINFMSDYLSLGHMQLATQVPAQNTYYIPHHPVFKPTSSSTKLRVVFDASAPTSTGVSLNDTLEVGPTVQSDLLSIILRFRTRDIAIAADIVKMYRQVQINEQDHDFQRILWRSSVDQPIEEYQLLTVTYGTAPAAYLATRALNQLVYDEGINFPLATEVILRDFYVDDCIFCCDRVKQAVSTYHQLNSLLSLGGFELRKWASNSQQFLSEVPSEHRAISNVLSFDDSSENLVHTLGLLWHVDIDSFAIHYKIPPKLTDKPFTKRLVLSAIASIFDPLGLISPVITPCKLFMQKLWSLKLDWDQQLPTDFLNSWQNIWNNLPALSNIFIPRLAKPLGSPRHVHLHVFADASQIAYGACAYLTVFTEHDSASHLMCAKSKIAPIKPLTVPRLELCAAVLASRLAQKLMSTLNLNIHNVWLWSDSTIVLSWIRRQPHEFKPFVSSRLAEISETTHDYTWLHVPSKSNPADLISRGSTPLELSQNSLWWHGPIWLTLPY